MTDYRQPRGFMNYKTVFIVDPVKGERIQLAKLLKQEKITIAGFVKLTDCFKKPNPLRCDVVIFVMRPGRAELKELNKVNHREKNIPFVIVTDPNAAAIELDEWKKKGFKSIDVASSKEKAKEITYNIISPDGPVPERKPLEAISLT
jgi:DNA-binding NtrC family response regulator